MGIDLRVGLTQKTKLYAYSFNISYFNFHECPQHADGMRLLDLVDQSVGNICDAF
jgi:hypothetical protein